jgi:hypothetical protein
MRQRRVRGQPRGGRRRCNQPPSYIRPRHAHYGAVLRKAYRLTPIDTARVHPCPAQVLAAVNALLDRKFRPRTWIAVDASPSNPEGAGHASLYVGSREANGALGEARAKQNPSMSAPPRPASVNPAQSAEPGKCCSNVF